MGAGKKDDYKHLSTIQRHKSSKERYLVMGCGRRVGKAAGRFLII